METEARSSPQENWAYEVGDSGFFFFYENVAKLCLMGCAQLGRKEGFLASDPGVSETGCQNRIWP